MIQNKNIKSREKAVCAFILCILLTGCGGSAPPDAADSFLPETNASIGRDVDGISDIISFLQIPTPSPEAEGLLSYDAKELVSQYETFPFGSHPMTEGAFSAMSNSNLCNMGYLCEAPDGTIYYSVSKSTEGAVYHANADGSGKTMIMDRRAGSLQFVGDKLYFWDEDTCLICAYDPQTQAFEPVCDTKVGHALVSDRCIYYCVTGGIYCFDRETGTTELLADTGEFLPIWTAMTEDILIYTLADETDSDMLTSNALLFAYSFRDRKSYYLCPYAWMPLLAGSQVYYQNVKTAVLESLDLNNGEIHSFSFCTSRPSLNENILYFYQVERNRPLLMSCELSTEQNAVCLELEENKRINYIYQTESYVYVFTADSDIYYYDKAGGFSGKF